MTWCEFKAIVESKGVTDVTPLFCIDIEGWYLRPVVVDFGKDGTAWIKHEGDAANEHTARRAAG